MRSGARTRRRKIIWLRGCAARRAEFAKLAQIVVLGVACVASGCAVDPHYARRAAATASAAQDHTTDCAPIRLDACAADSPYRALVGAALAESTATQPVHIVNLLDRGEDALLLRLHLIRSAQRSIDVQTFIFNEDDAGYLILDELIKAARRGVKVRVITDQLFSLDDQLYAALARAHENFELRVYNPTFHKARTPPLEFAAGILCCFWRFNQRMHDKLILIDDSIGIVGGRNYENRYFDWDDEFDYRDRDVLVAGPVGTAMRSSFDAFWKDPHTARLSRLRDVAGDIVSAGMSAPAYAAHSYRDAARVADLSRRADDLQYVRTLFADHAQRVGRVDYFADTPGKPPSGQVGAARESTAPLEALLRAAKDEIVLQTPYLVLSSTAQRLFRDLRKRKPAMHILVSTNSLAATDAFYVYALSYKYKKRYMKLGFEIHEFKPFPDEADRLVANYAQLGKTDRPNNPANPRIQPKARYSSAPLKRHGVRIGLHAKSMVIDNEITVIGSHNFDPRSELHNTEAGIIIHDRSFAATVRAAILLDSAPDNSWTIAHRKASTLLGHVNNAIADFSAALPLFDFWPFRYASSFELKPGCAPLRPGAPGFFDCYVDVGDFPEVDLPLKTIYTRIVTAFGAGLTSIM